MNTSFCNFSIHIIYNNEIVCVSGPVYVHLQFENQQTNFHQTWHAYSL
jgi:hypothetical protein